MSPVRAKSLETRINRLEKVVDVVLRQDDGDWLNSSKLAERLDKIASDKSRIPEREANI